MDRPECDCDPKRVESPQRRPRVNRKGSKPGKRLLHGFISTSQRKRMGTPVFGRSGRPKHRAPPPIVISSKDYNFFG